MNLEKETRKSSFVREKMKSRIREIGFVQQGAGRGVDTGFDVCTTAAVCGKHEGTLDKNKPILSTKQRNIQQKLQHSGRVCSKAAMWGLEQKMQSTKSMQKYYNRHCCTFANKYSVLQPVVVSKQFAQEANIEHRCCDKHTCSSRAIWHVMKTWWALL